MSWIPKGLTSIDRFKRFFSKIRNSTWKRAWITSRRRYQMCSNYSKSPLKTRTTRGSKNSSGRLKNSNKMEIVWKQRLQRRWISRDRASHWCLNRIMMVFLFQSHSRTRMRIWYHQNTYQAIQSQASRIRQKISKSCSDQKKMRKITRFCND